MRVIKPRLIIPAVGWGDGIGYSAEFVSELISTTATEIYATYSAATNYGVGEKVYSPFGNIIYESVIPNNQGYPLNNTPLWTAGSYTSLPHPEKWDAAKTYTDGDFVYILWNESSGLKTQTVHRPAVVPNTGHTPLKTGSDTYWTIVDSYPVPWLPNVEYAVGRVVIYPFPGNSTYVNTLSNSLNKVPSFSKAWQEVSSSNKKNMFDYTSNVKTSSPSPLVVSIATLRRVNAIDLSGLANVQTVRIQMSNGGSPVYDQTINMTKRNVMSYYDWFFQPFVYKKSAAKFDLPPYSNGIITLTFTSASGNVEVGSVIIGSQFYVGQTQYSAVRDYTNYSTVQREFDGSIAKLVQRQGIPKTRQTVYLEKANVQALSDLLLSLDATPAAWNGIDDATDGYFEPIHIVGFVKSAPIDISYPSHAVCSLELEAISSN